MKKGFLDAVKAADGPRTRYTNKRDATADSGGAASIAELTASLREAEAQLRQRREERLRVEGEEDAKAGGATDAKTQKAAVTLLPAQLPESAFQALASHAEPPPSALKLLAESLMLLLEAEPLIGLGEHPLPGDIPWRNLQQLLGRNAGRQSVTSLAVALDTEPQGPKLRAAIRERLLGGDQPLTREQVADADAECACIYDFIKAFVAEAPSEGGLRLLVPKETAVEEPVSTSERELAAVAVAQQEQKVSKLRRQLRDARQRQQDMCEKETNDIAAKKAAIKEAQILQDAEKESKRVGKEALVGSMQHVESEPSKELVNEVQAVGVDARAEVVSCITQSVEYTLGEDDVQSLQESVLYSMVNALAEPRLNTHRKLEITGYSEVREEAEVAAQRAIKVRDWLIDHGAADDNIIIEPPCPDEKRGSRKTVLKLVDRSKRVQDAKVNAARLSPSFDSIRNHSKDILESSALKSSERGYGSAESSLPKGNSAGESTTGSDPAALSPDAGVNASHTSQDVQKCSIAEQVFRIEEDILAPHVLIEELSVESSDANAGRKLQVTFASPALDAKDAELEVGEWVVRLASASKAWHEVKASLPFAVDPSTASAPKFSRKRGTLTLCLSGA